MEEEKRVDTAEAAETAEAASDGTIAAQESASAEADEKAQLTAELEALRNENRELNDKALRLVAEMENLRRRTERDKAEFSKYAISDFARELLTVGDNIRRAIESVDSEKASSDPALRSLIEGVEVTERELIKAFEKQQIKRFDPLGEPFNPHLHDAMTRIDAPNVAADTVVQVIHAGYMIAERVLRPAAVMVAKGGSGSEVKSNENSAEEPSPLPLGATKVPEEVQAVEESAAVAPTGKRAETRTAAGREFQVERRRSTAGIGGNDDRIAQIRRQRPQGDAQRTQQHGAGKPSALHKPVINSGKD